MEYNNLEVIMNIKEVFRNRVIVRNIDESIKCSLIIDVENGDSKVNIFKENKKNKIINRIKLKKE